MWSLTSPRAERISCPEKFVRQPTQAALESLLIEQPVG